MLALCLVHEDVRALDQVGGEVAGDAAPLGDRTEAEAHDADVDLDRVRGEPRILPCPVMALDRLFEPLRDLCRLGASGQVRVLSGSALILPRSEPFDLIFADPPYGPGSGSAALQAILDAGWLAEGGWVSIETARGESVDAGALSVDASRDVGAARLTLLRWT